VVPQTGVDSAGIISACVIQHFTPPQLPNPSLTSKQLPLPNDDPTHLCGTAARDLVQYPSHITCQSSVISGELASAF
jgi:hypothetical protein